MGRAKKPIPAEAPAALLAQYLRELRQRAGLTYEQMATMLRYKAGCSLASLSRADSGSTIPDRTTVDHYVWACGGKTAEVNRSHVLWRLAHQNQRLQKENPNFKIRSRRPRPITDPDLIREPLQLIDALVHLRDRVGRPPLRHMAIDARQAGQPVSRSTLSDVFAGQRMPSLQTVRAIVMLYDDRHPAAAWEMAWRRVKQTRFS